jgi:UDP-N-acetyl-D-mannosaminuronic acid transferase (WecB/TagA/CpsF family)
MDTITNADHAHAAKLERAAAFCASDGVALVRAAWLGEARPDRVPTLSDRLAMRRSVEVAGCKAYFAAVAS